MSNDIIASLKNDLAIIGGLDEDTKAVAGGVSANKRISIKGGVFRKYAGGKEVGAIEDRHMNVIFVKMAHHPSRTFYSGAFKEGEKVSPLCWSSDSKTPDPEVKAPQSSKCETCKFAAKGSGQSGVGSACRLSWRTAVVLPQDTSGDVMQLVLPATSVFGKEENGKWPFREYVKMLANHNISAGRVITKMQFDTKATAPRVLFSPVSGIKPDDLEVLAEQAKSQAAEAAVKLTVYQADESASTAANETPAPEVQEPKVRRSAAPAAVATAEVTDVLKEWTKK
jgi:hypothetical protein